MHIQFLLYVAILQAKFQFIALYNNSHFCLFFFLKSPFLFMLLNCSTRAYYPYLLLSSQNLTETFTQNSYDFFLQKNGRCISLLKPHTWL